jgi:HSP20 family protein
MTSLLIPRRSRRSAFPALRGVRSLDELFDNFWCGFETAAPAWPMAKTAHAFTPRVDVRETDEEIVVSAELPGLEENDFDISLEEDVLTLKGEKRSEHEEKREGFHRVETTSGSFERRLRLPCEVDADAVKATYKNGVVTVVLPKRPEDRPEARTVPITSA